MDVLQQFTIEEPSKQGWEVSALLKEAESVEIIALMDNSLDFLSSIPRREVKNFRGWVKKPSRLPIAEHGFSMLIRVSDGNGFHSFLFDTGGSPNGVITNAKRMHINLAEIECIVLSHGHYDHFGGLSAIAKAVNKDGLPIIVHEDAFKTRGVANPDGTIRKYPKFPKEDEVKPAKYVKIKQPYLIAEGLALSTGEIPRKTEFEKGYPRHMVFVDGKWRPDPWIRDDQALVINLKQKGLVIISGCAHAGIINTVLYAQEITGVEKIYAILGGFHLSGRRFEPRIDQTVEELKKFNPRLIAPSHCTGWRGICRIASAMPDAFVWNSVGNLYRL
mgnify:CR=1 FL=1